MQSLSGPPQNGGSGIYTVPPSFYSDASYTQAGGAPTPPLPHLPAIPWSWLLIGGAGIIGLIVLRKGLKHGLV